MDRIRAFPGVARKVTGHLETGITLRQSSLRFIAFGPGHVERDEQPIPVSKWRSATPRYLTFYLLTHPPRSMEQIIATFWPDTSPDRARSTFHVIKQRVHNALGRSLIVHEDGRYRVDWEPGFWFDVPAFEALLEESAEIGPSVEEPREKAAPRVPAGSSVGQEISGDRGDRISRLEQAVTLYRDDFLEGYDAEWCRPIRERLRLRFLDGLVELGERYSDQSRFDRAFLVLSQAAALDDMDERTVRALMRLYAGHDRRMAAVELYRQLDERLQRELGISPGRKTRTLYQTITGDT